MLYRIVTSFPKAVIQSVTVTSQFACSIWFVLCTWYVVHTVQTKYSTVLYVQYVGQVSVSDYSIYSIVYYILVAESRDASLRLKVINTTDYIRSFDFGLSYQSPTA